MPSSSRAGGESDGVSPRRPSEPRARVSRKPQVTRHRVARLRDGCQLDWQLADAAYGSLHAVAIGPANGRAGDGAMRPNSASAPHPPKMRGFGEEQVRSPRAADTCCRADAVLLCAVTTVPSEFSEERRLGIAGSSSFRRWRESVGDHRDLWPGTSRLVRALERSSRDNRRVGLSSRLP
jgi:hypothetical protein